MWEREEEYKVELEQVIQKAGTSRLERLASLALEDERTCYKHVLVLLEKQYRKCGPNMRGKLHLLYCVSTLLRQSRKQQGVRDRYAERLQPLTSALVIDLRLEYSAQIDKLLKLWRMENVYSADQLLELESGRSAQVLRQSGSLLSKSPSGSLTEASAQDPHVGIGDASGSGRSSAIQSYPRFPGGRGQPSIPGTMPAYQPPAPPEGQDPYSADSNPNASRTAPTPQPPPPPPPPTLPPPPPTLIPPGLLGPVGPPGMLPQGSAAAAAAAAAGLFQQGQLSGFLGAPVPALMQQGTFMPALGAFHGGNMSNGMAGALPGAAAPGLGVGVGVGVGGVMGGGMGGTMPFQGPPGPMPPGLTLQRPPLYPQPPVYNNQGHQGQNQGTRALNTLSYNRFNQSNGRMPPGLGPSSGPGQSSAHGPGQGWQGRFGSEAHGLAAGQGLPPPPPRPPPGSPPHSGDGRGTTAPAVQGGTTAPGANGIHRGGGVTNSSGHLIPPGLGPSSTSMGAAEGGGGSASSTQGAAATGYIRPSGRRSRWELERDSSGAPVAPSATTAAGSEPLPKRPALAAEAGGGGGTAAPEDAAMKPSVPAPESKAMPPSSPAGAIGAGDEGRTDKPGVVAATPPQAESASFIRQPQEDQQQAGEVKQHARQDRLDPVVLGRCGQQTHDGAKAAAVAAADTPMDVDNGDGQACSHVAEDVAVADGKADPDSVVEADERLARVGTEEAVSGKQHDARGVLVPDGGHLEAALRAPAAEGVVEVLEVDDGGSSSAEPVCPAAQHHDSTAPSSPGRPGGGAEQGDSRDRGGDAAGGHVDQRDLAQDEQRRVEQQQQQQREQQQRRGSSSGAGDSGNDRLSAAIPEGQGQAADGVASDEPQRQQEAARRQQQEQEQVGETKAAEAVTSTNQPLLGEQRDAQLHASHDVQSAEQPPVQATELPVMQSSDQGAQEPTEQTVAQSDGAQTAMDDLLQQGARGREIETCIDAVPPTAAMSDAEVAPAPDTAAANAGLAHAAASGLAELDAAAVPAAPDAPDAEADPTASAANRTTAPAQAVGVSDAAPGAELKPVPALQTADPAPPAPAQCFQQAVQAVQPPPLHSSSAVLLSSYDDSRVPLQLEELELGELDDTWLE